MTAVNPYAAPKAAVADDYYAACERGWSQTLAQFKAYVERVTGDR